MRKYSKLGPTFWTGETGKALRRKGPMALLVAAYLISSPHANMLGLYYQPMLYMAHETGLGIEGASNGLAACVECGFCSYDEATEMVWVHEMAAWQIEDALSSGDKRCKGIQNDYLALPINPFLAAWFDRYREAFHLTKRHETLLERVNETKGLEKPLRSQEQEQEQEQEREVSDLRSSSPDGDPQAGPDGQQELETVPPRPKTAKQAKDQAALIPCPYATIVGLYHAKLPMLPRCRLMPEERQKALRRAWGWVLSSSKSDGSRRATTAEEALDWFAGYFGRAAENDFVTGKTGRSAEHAKWRADLDYLLTDRGMKQVIEKTEAAA